MYTANTMACAIEALGMSLPNSSAQLAIGPRRRRTALRAGAAVHRLLEARHPPARHHDAQGVRERDHGGDRARRLDQRGAAPARHRALGQVKLSIDDFTRIGKRVPVLADLKPSGKYGMAALVGSAA
jgi:dihydroxy-acid dehydratase